MTLSRQILSYSLGMSLLASLDLACSPNVPPPRHIDEVGGVVLAYDIIKKTVDAGEKIDEAAARREAVEFFRMRLKDAKLHHITVRFVPPTRVEISIPRVAAVGPGVDPAAKQKIDEILKIDVKKVKGMIPRTGWLEFRVLANSNDDQEGIAAAQKVIDRLTPQELEDLAGKGLPPPGPGAGQKDLAIFSIHLPGNEKSLVSYSWVELGPHQCASLSLDSAAANDPTRNAIWKVLAESRGKAILLDEPGTGKKMMHGALFFSRSCQNRLLPEPWRQEKGIEYYVLSRNPEVDPADPAKKKPTPKIDGSYLVSAMVAPGPAVHLNLNQAGGDLLGTLTRKNLPSGSGDARVKRHLAILLNEVVITAPTIDSEIHERAQITGKFTFEEVDDLVNVLRAGAFSARGHWFWAPVSQTVMEPKKE